MSGGATATFVYDGDGNRVKTTVAGTTTAYIGNYYELTGSAYKKYYYAGSVRVALSDNGTLTWLLGDHLGSTSLTANGTTGALLTELRYKPWGENRYTSGTTPTTYRFTGQRQEAALGGADGLYYYGARWYDPATGRFAQADSIVPDGDKASIVPLTVDFHELQFLAALNAENAFTLQRGFWFQLSADEKREAKVQRGPLNPQALNRFSYVLGNPIKYTDPSGHYYCTGGELDAAACTAWVESMLRDLEASGVTGADLVKRFRERDAALMATKIIGLCSGCMHPGIQFGFTPFISGGMVLPGENTVSLNDRYASSSLDAWDLALVGHELTHLLNQNTDRMSTRSEAEAYASEGRILDDLGEKPTELMSTAMSTNLDNATSLAKFKQKLVDWALTVDWVSAAVYWVSPTGAPQGGQQAPNRPIQPGVSATPSTPVKPRPGPTPK